MQSREFVLQRPPAAGFLEAAMTMRFPYTRNRRLRRTGEMRELVRENTLHPSDLIAPLFVDDALSGAVDITSMPGIRRHGLDSAAEHARALHGLGIPCVALFPHIDPGLKNESGSAALDAGGFLYRAIRHLKHECPGLLIMADVALDPFTSHGHDGLLHERGAEILNDATVEVLARMAVIEADAGADIVAPSDMMDGRVGAIRAELDAHAHEHVAILSYAAKFASCLYGPFRDAVGSSSAAGTRLIDKRSYQIDPANSREAIRDALLDESEGADILMVKPAGWYLDIIRALRESTRLPVAAYQVSGEYAMIQAAATRLWIDPDRAAVESVLGIKRAGADVILTYFAEELAGSCR